MQGLGQVLGLHRVAETDIDDGLGRAVDLGGIVFGIGSRGFAAPHARFAPLRIGQLTHQRVRIAVRELALHLLAYAAILPPIEHHHEQNEQNAQ